MHKQKGKYRYLSVGGVGQYKQKEKYLSVVVGGNRNSFFWQLHGEAGTWWYQGVVRTLTVWS
jgi:DNA relaxase NicK